MRTTKGSARTRAKKRLFRRVKGFVGGRRKLLRTAKESLIRSGVFAYRDRRQRKRMRTPRTRKHMRTRSLSHRQNATRLIVRRSQVWVADWSSE